MCVAMPGRVLSIEARDGRSIPSLVDLGDGQVHRVDLVMVPDAVVGDYVTVHSGFAIAIVDMVAAEETIALFRRSTTPANQPD